VTSRPEWSTARRPPDVETFPLRVNGRAGTVTCRGDTPLLYLLRNDLGLPGSRFGCGLGQCGACVVLVDGRPTASCDLPVQAVADAEITTVEGLSDDPVMQSLQGAFLDGQAAQCGYCMSGILVTSCALLRTDPAPDHAGVTTALDGHLCRCGSQGRVLRAVQRAAETLRGGRHPADDRPGQGLGPAHEEEGER
jgi:nicotinate dehydrogenase subunit A